MINALNLYKFMLLLTNHYMEAVYIKPTKETPEVVLDKERNIFKIAGMSLPEDVKQFYLPIIHWFKEYFKSPNKDTMFHVRLFYMNSGSSKFIYEIFQEFRYAFQDGHNVEILWQYNPEDEEMGDAGEDYAILLNGVPFNTEAVDIKYD